MLWFPLALTVAAMEATPAGWYPDPANPLQERLWDGTDWVDRVRPRHPSAAYEGAWATQPTGDDDNEVAYRLSREALQKRSQLEEALRRRGIEYYWDGQELVVDKEAESAVDAVVRACVPGENIRTSTEDTNRSRRRRFFGWSALLIAGVAFVGLLVVEARRDTRTESEVPGSTDTTVMPPVSPAAMEREKACPQVRLTIQLMEQWLRVGATDKSQLVSLTARMRSLSIEISGMLRDDGRSERGSMGISSELEQALEREFTKQYGQGAPLLNSNLAMARLLKSEVDEMESYSNTLTLEDMWGVVSPLELSGLWSDYQRQVEGTADSLAGMCGWTIDRPNPGDYGYENARWRLEPIR